MAIATPLGVGALGIVRLSGERSFEIVETFFESAPPLGQAAPQQALYGKILLSTRNPLPLDWVVAVKYAAPKSYTGENSVEIIAHGSPVILKKILSLALKAGAREALPGEFTQRAYLNGKMDLAQAQAVAGLIRAGSERASRLYAGVVSGLLSAKIRRSAGEIVEALAMIDVMIDHADDAGLIESVNTKLPGQTARRLIGVFEQMIASFEQHYKWREGMSVAIVGAPNAGKSTLLNALLAKDRAIVSAAPGTTRDTVEDLVEINGGLIRLIDTAGWRETSEPVESLGIERTRLAAANADLIIWVRDGANGRHKEAPLENLIGRQKIIFEVWNKCDLTDFQARNGEARAMPGLAGSFVISAHRGDGLEELKSAMAKQMEGINGGEAVVTEERQADLLRCGREDLERGLTHLEHNAWDLAGFELRHALGDCHGITGEDGISEEILSSIFSKFCVGK